MYRIGNIRKRMYMITAVVTLLASSVITGCEQKANTVESEGDNAISLPTENLAKETDIGVTIDYAIESYKSVENFSYQLFAENMEDTNPVLSPVSAYLALTMAGEGTDGNTKKQFMDVLGEDMVALSYDMMNQLPVNTDELSILLANSAWLDDQFEVKDEWLGTVTSLFDADVYQTTLSSKKTMKQMNNWISDKTYGLIDNMLTEPLSNHARLVLFNTIYFKGKWENVFWGANDDEFTTESGDKISTAFMRQYAEQYDYIENAYTRGVFMPYITENYETDKYAMLALLPKDGKTVREMYHQLITDKDILSTFLAQRESKSVNLKLPKFDITFDKILNDSLNHMGLTDAFDVSTADFSQLVSEKGDENLYISLVRQKAVIKVDEQGTEAAAATEVGIECTAVLETDEPIDVYFNQPFLYMIVDMEREIPLFIGIIDNPAIS